VAARTSRRSSHLGLLDRLRSRAEPVPAADRWLVAGLGNPEAEYAGTRHNIGADVVRRLAEELGATFKPHKKIQAHCADTWESPGGLPLTLVIPFGYMNRSGGPVQQAMAFYKVPHERLVGVYEDLKLDLGKLRFKHGGGDAGHNGLRDIRRRSGSGDYYRVRVGIGRPPGRQDPADYVLKRFSTRDRETVDVAVEEACDAIRLLVREGLEPAQNRHHR
jgi:peptidyl-tRNA hydrolase, PTH1 family